MTFRSGIVIKKYFPYKQKIALLDRDTGVVEYMVAHENICLGAAVEYTIRSQGNFKMVEQINTIDVPLRFAQSDLIFFHQLLELCYHFVPSESGFPELFDLIKYIYECPVPLSSRLQQIILIKFFVLLGMYPDSRNGVSLLFSKVTVLPIDILVDLDLDLGCEQDIKKWLYSCVALHPKANLFKTLHYF
jgi:hypothetical protein